MAVCTRELQRLCSSTLTMHGLVVVTECVRRWYGTLAVPVAVWGGWPRQRVRTCAGRGRRPLSSDQALMYTVSAIGGRIHTRRADRPRDSRAFSRALAERVAGAGRAVVSRLSGSAEALIE